MPALPLGLFLIAVGCLEPQDPAPAPAAADLLRQKLAEPFLARGGWTTDYDAARARAAANGKLILGYFTTAGY